MKCFGEHWGLEFSREEIAAARARQGLLSMELELSRACNLRCLYCYAESGIAPKNELSLDEILDVVDQAIALGARKIIVLGGGEPMLYPHLFTVIDAILAKGASADVFTNGMLVTPEKAKMLYDREISVVVKMNSRRAEVQDLLAGQKGAFAAIEKGLANLMAAGYPSAKHTLGVETIVCRQNYDELPDLWRWARKQNIVPYVEMMTLQGRAKDNPDLEVSSQEARQLFEKLSTIDRDEFNTNWTPHPPLAASQCARHEYSCTVTSLGEIHPCPGVSISAGNIKENKLAEIINASKVIQDLRLIRERIKGPCATCDFNLNCYGCRGHAYQVTGDYLASDPTCWLQTAEK